jgi:hypothetical protein
MEQVIYSMTTLGDAPEAEQFLERTESPEQRIRGTYIRTLCLAYHIPEDLCERVFERCPNVINLACWNPRFDLAPHITFMSFQRLSLRIEFNSHPFPSQHKAFAHLTHIHFTNVCFVVDYETILVALPSLTHLSIDVGFKESQHFSCIMPGILKSLPGLRLCYIFDRERCLEALHLDGPRVFVKTPQAGQRQTTAVPRWEAFAREGENRRVDDYWIEGEQAIAIREAKQDPYDLAKSRLHNNIATPSSHRP